MLEQIIAIIAILALALGAVALFFSMRKPTPPPPPPPPPPPSFIDMAEFKGLNSDITGMYRDNIVNGLAPLMVQQVNAQWAALTPAQRTQIVQLAAAGEKLAAARYAKLSNAPNLAAMLKSMPH